MWHLAPCRCGGVLTSPTRAGLGRHHHNLLETSSYAKPLTPCGGLGSYNNATNNIFFSNGIMHWDYMKSLKGLHTIYWCNIWKILHTTNLPWLPSIKIANMDKIWKIGVHIHLVVTTFKCLRKAQVRKMLQLTFIFHTLKRLNSITMKICTVTKIYLKWLSTKKKPFYFQIEITSNHRLAGKNWLEPWQLNRTLCYLSVHDCWPWCLTPCWQAGKNFPHTTRPDFIPTLSLKLLFC